MNTLDPRYKETCLRFTENRELVAELQKDTTDYPLFLRAIGHAVDCTLAVYPASEIDEMVTTILALFKSMEKTYKVFSEFASDALVELLSETIYSIIELALRKRGL